MPPDECGGDEGKKANSCDNSDVLWLMSGLTRVLNIASACGEVSGESSLYPATHIRLSDERKCIIQTLKPIVFENVDEGVLLAVLDLPAACEFEVVRFIPDEREVVVLAVLCERDSKDAIHTTHTAATYSCTLDGLTWCPARVS